MSAHEPRQTDEPWRLRLSDAVSKHGELAAIARRAEMSSSQLQKLANGTTRSPSVSTLKRISNALGLTLEHFLSDSFPDAETDPSDLASHLRQKIGELSAPGNDSRPPADWRADVLAAIEILARTLRQHQDEERTKVDRAATDTRQARRR